MTVIAKAARWLVTRPTARPGPTSAVRHIEHDYRYPPCLAPRRPGVDAQTRRQAMHLVGRR